MAYRSVEEAVTAYLERYDLPKAIARCKLSKKEASSESAFQFWTEVEVILVMMKAEAEVKRLRALKFNK